MTDNGMQKYRVIFHMDEAAKAGELFASVLKPPE
jgi:hypothetical protein